VIKRKFIPDWALLAYGLTAIAAALCMVLGGCGSGVATGLPGAGQPLTAAAAGPVLGYVFSPSDGTLRSMMGVRGSAQMSASIVPAGVYVAGEASVASNTALLEDGSGTLFAFNLPQSQPLHVADKLAPGVRIAFSASGKNAIAYVPGGSAITVISGLPGVPQIQTRNVPAGVQMASAVVSDAGTIALAAESTPMAVGVLSAAGQYSSLVGVKTLGGMSFMPGADDLMIADRGANTATLVRNASGNASSQVLAIAGLNQPMAIAGSHDGRWAVIADGGDGNIFRVDLTGGTATAKLACACQPTMLGPLSGGGTFRLNALYGGPLWTVDSTSASAQLLFVPAIAKGTP
jgi:hypothetical protein